MTSHAFVPDRFTFWLTERQTDSQFRQRCNKWEECPNEENHSVHTEHADALDALDEERQLWFQPKLFTKARRLDVPVPDVKDEFVSFENMIWLRRGRGLVPTEVARCELIAAVRKEERARQEARVRIITALTGLVAAISGLAALARLDRTTPVLDGGVLPHAARLQAALPVSGMIRIGAVGLTDESDRTNPAWRARAAE
jgi:hypothetical protein